MLSGGGRGVVVIISDSGDGGPGFDSRHPTEKTSGPGYSQPPGPSKLCGDHGCDMTHK